MFNGSCGLFCFQLFFHSFCFQENVKLELVEDVLRLLEVNALKKVSKDTSEIKMKCSKVKHIVFVIVVKHIPTTYHWT